MQSIVKIPVVKITLNFMYEIKKISTIDEHEQIQSQSKKLRKTLMDMKNTIHTAEAEAKAAAAAVEKAPDEAPAPEEAAEDVISYDSLCKKVQEWYKKATNDDRSLTSKGRKISNLFFVDNCVNLLFGGETVEHFAYYKTIEHENKATIENHPSKDLSNVKSQFLQYLKKYLKKRKGWYDMDCYLTGLARCQESLNTILNTKNLGEPIVYQLVDSIEELQIYVLVSYIQNITKRNINESVKRFFNYLVSSEGKGKYNRVFMEPRREIKQTNGVIPEPEALGILYFESYNSRFDLLMNMKDKLTDSGIREVHMPLINAFTAFITVLLEQTLKLLIYDNISPVYVTDILGRKKLAFVTTDPEPESTEMTVVLFEQEIEPPKLDPVAIEQAKSSTKFEVGDRVIVQGILGKITQNYGDTYEVRFENGDTIPKCFYSSIRKEVVELKIKQSELRRVVGMQLSVMFASAAGEIWRKGTVIRISAEHSNHVVIKFDDDADEEYSCVLSKTNFRLLKLPTAEVPKQLISYLQDD